MDRDEILKKAQAGAIGMDEREQHKRSLFLYPFFQ